MKIDKTNLAHWLYLLLFGLNVMAALLLRPFRRRGRSPRVILYGHKLGGNLLALYRELQAHPGIEVAFLTMDPAYHRELLAKGEASVLAISPRCIRWLAAVDAVVSGHGLHSLQPMLSLSDIKFFDVWHGIPYKGFDADDFRVQHRYDEVWVSSPLLRDVYIDRFGFPPAIVHATGYARTDRLVRRDEDIAAIKRELGLDPASTDKLVLFAPTWKQDAHNRSLFPFGLDEAEFFGALAQLGERLGATFLMRAHLNSGGHGLAPDPRIVHLPHARYPDTEQILLVSDIMVCDWSSIAFDYLLLDRPTIFLDVEPPFAKGLSLDAQHRFGAIAADMDQLLALLERYLVDPGAYSEFATTCAWVKSRAYGALADGHASRRCVERLEHHVARPGSSR